MVDTGERVRERAARKTLSLGLKSPVRGVDHGTLPSGIGVGQRDGVEGPCLRRALAVAKAAASSSESAGGGGASPRSRSTRSRAACLLTRSRRMFSSQTSRGAKHRASPSRESSRSSAGAEPLRRLSSVNWVGHI
eukprot:scaffold114116_cov28-Tisochrysis_lutea.AAC.1